MEKKYFLHWSFLFVCAGLLAACSKYDDDPWDDTPYFTKVTKDTVNAILVETLNPLGYDTGRGNYVNQITLFDRYGTKHFVSMPDSNWQYNILYGGAGGIVNPDSAIGRKGDTVGFSVNSNLRWRQIFTLYSADNLSYEFIASDTCKIYFKYFDPNVYWWAAVPDTVSSKQLGNCLNYYFPNTIQATYYFKWQ